MLNFLSKTPVLIFMLIAFLAIGYSFSWLQAGLGEWKMLDIVMNGEEARAQIAGMTEAQRAHHMFATLVNDTAYPLAYGGLFAGLAARFGGQYGGRLALPALATVIVDFLENTVQALALSGTGDLLAVKDVLTPLKFGLFMLAGLIALGLIIAAVFRRLTKTA